MTDKGRGLMHFDSTINAGHILTALTVLVAVVLGYARISGVQETQQWQIDRLSASVTDHSTRLRSVESAIAAQTSDLENIRSSTSEIKSILNKVYDSEMRK